MLCVPHQMPGLPRRSSQTQTTLNSALPTAYGTAVFSRSNIQNTGKKRVSLYEREPGHFMCCRASARGMLAGVNTAMVLKRTDCSRRIWKHGSMRQANVRIIV